MFKFVLRVPKPLMAATRPSCSGSDFTVTTPACFRQGNTKLK
jgi:hypothetical protein